MTPLASLPDLGHVLALRATTNILLCEGHDFVRFINTTFTPAEQ
jgi:hypothetical protein